MIQYNYKWVSFHMGLSRAADAVSRGEPSSRRKANVSFACTIIVHGRVQGVCFRASTVSEAGRLGVTGWVRNEPGGEVRVEAEGTREALEALIDWCRQGPEYATVDRLDVDWHAPGLDATRFAIR